MYIILIETATDCIIGKTQYASIPTLVTEDGEILNDASDWLRDLRVTQAKAETTVREYAKILREFIQRMADSRRDWKLVDDDVLRNWRDEMFHLSRRSGSRVNIKLEVVVAFYLWCEKKGSIKGVVGTGDMYGQHPITIKEITRKSARGLRTVRLTTPLLLKTFHKPARHTPNEAEIQAVHGRLYGRHAVRNGLILSWAEETGLRRFEINALKISDIPSWEEIDKLRFDDRVHSIVVKGKGGRSRRVHARPELLNYTRDWIEIERADIIKRTKARMQKHNDPGFVFLSNRGLSLNLNSVSNLVGDLFRRANVKDSSLHRLRATFLTRIADRFIAMRDKDNIPLPIESILLHIREIAGWQDIETIRYYVVSSYRRSVIHPN